MMCKSGKAIFFLIGLLVLLTGCASPSMDETRQPESPVTEPATEPPTAQSEISTEETITETPTEAPRDVLWRDDFSDVTSGWERYRKLDGVLDYVEEEGVYQMQVQAENNLWWVYKDEALPDVTMAVDVWQVGGPDGSLYGLMCRYDPDTTNGYVFLISNDGQAGVGLNDQGFRSLRGGELAKFDVINTGMEARNTLEVSCVGETLKMSVNGELLFTLPAGDSLGEDIGLAVATVQGSGADVYFDNLTVYQP
ncbi:MAG: hypothetical protein SVR81_08250 [Chloroflexota bacterium]|nr:hypothetical protein [Chloroflexota bacterium]